MFDLVLFRTPSTGQVRGGGVEAEGVGSSTRTYMQQAGTASNRHIYRRTDERYIHERNTGGIYI